MEVFRIDRVRVDLHMKRGSLNSLSYSDLWRAAFAAGLSNPNSGGGSMIIRLVFFLGLLTTAGCGSQIRNVPVANIIMVNADGQPVNPARNIECEKDSHGICDSRHSIFRNYKSYEEGKDYHDKEGEACGPKEVKNYPDHIIRVMDCVEAYKTNNRGRSNSILIHIHGGLNFQVDSVERAAELYLDILKGGSYPIFINWQSSFFPSYWNHLTHIRQGEDWSQGTWSRYGAYVTAPFYLAADLARAAIRLPTAAFFQARNDLETVPWLSWFHSEDLVLAQQTVFEELCSRKKHGDNNVAHALEEYSRILDKSSAGCEKVEGTRQPDFGNLWLGVDETTGWEYFEGSIKYILTLPTKLVSAPVIDALGTSSWNVMLRSVSQLFHHDSRKVSHTGWGLSQNGTHDFSQTGALSVFFEELRRKICHDDKQSSDAAAPKSEKCANEDGWEITLVGHSMGAIIANHIIREFGDLPIRNVVYMAAASTIQDYQDTIFPYLKKRNHWALPSDKSNLCSTDKKPPTSSIEREDVCVYHLMLHEAAESGEWLSDILDPFPRGSLLVWLDNFLTHPLSREDRRLGRFTNFILAAHHTPPELRPYINIVKFGVGDGVLSPQKHGEFGGKLEFWKPECWGGPAEDPRNCYRGNGHY